jgi:hypothetical protein
MAQPRGEPPPERDTKHKPDRRRDDRQDYDNEHLLRLLRNPLAFTNAADEKGEPTADPRPRPPWLFPLLAALLFWGVVVLAMWVL